MRTAISISGSSSASGINSSASARPIRQVLRILLKKNISPKILDLRRQSKHRANEEDTISNDSLFGAGSLETNHNPGYSCLFAWLMQAVSIISFFPLLLLFFLAGSVRNDEFS